MDQVEFAGITFRSSVHWLWFLFTGGLFVVTALLALSLAQWRKRSRSAPDPILVWDYPLYIHATVAGVALIVTRGGRREYGSYSPDCIWWNLLVAGCYWLILAFFKRRRRRSSQVAV